MYAASLEAIGSVPLNLKLLNRSVLMLDREAMDSGSIPLIWLLDRIHVRSLVAPMKNVDDIVPESWFL